MKQLPDHSDMTTVSLRVAALRQEVAADGANRHGSLPKPGGDCAKVPFCARLEHTACRTAVQPTVSTHLLAATDAEGGIVEASLDRPNGGKKDSERLCRMGFLDYK